MWVNLGHTSDAVEKIIYAAFEWNLWAIRPIYCRAEHSRQG